MLESGAATELAPRERRLLLRPASPAAAPAHATAIRLDGGGAVPRSRLALPAGRPARPLAGRRSRRLPLDRRRLAGVPLEGQVIYEMHIGTFTREGTWDGRRARAARAGRRRHHRARGHAGRRFPGRFGWGYDGVDLFAPTRLYGAPDDFRRFVDEAHALGLGVILDVVYNHFGPDGNYLQAVLATTTSPTATRTSGARRINFDGENAGPVREFFVANAAYWIDEFHLDGLRLDATQQIFDASPEHILAR